jgi:hypothetical protein
MDGLPEVAAAVNGVETPAPGGAFGKLPNAIACDPDIDECALVMVAARLTYGGRFVMQPGWAQKLVRRGLGERPYWRGLGCLTERGLVERRKAANGRQGHGVVVDDRVRLPEGDAEHYRHVEQRWFDGTLSVKGLAALLFMRARACGEAKPWHISTRFDWSLGTVKAVANELCHAGLVERLGGAQNPVYRACNSQNPQSKNRRSKNRRSKNRRVLLTDQPLRTDQSLQIDQLLRKRRYRAALNVHGDGTDATTGKRSAEAPPVARAERTERLPEGSHGERIIRPQDRTAEVMAAVAEERQRHTEAALSETEQAIGRGDREPWTPATLRMVGAMRVDVPALVKRYWERTQGRTVDDPNAYLLAMAKNTVAKRVGTTREVLVAIGEDRAAVAGPDARARAQAEHREDLAHRLGGGDLVRGYALLLAIPDSPHRRSGPVPAKVRPGPEVAPPTVPMPLSTVLTGIIPTR